MLLTQTQLTELIREYYKTIPIHERMGQWLVNRTPLRITDPDLFYEVDNAIAVQKYQERYVVASPEEAEAWIKEKTEEGVPRVDLEDVRTLIRGVEFSTSGKDGSSYVTICTLTTDTGFKAIGKGSALHEDSFNENVAKLYAFNRAFTKLVEHHSYLVRYLLHQQGLTQVRRCVLKRSLRAKE